MYNVKTEKRQRKQGGGQPSTSGKGNKTAGRLKPNKKPFKKTPTKGSSSKGKSK